MSHLTPQVLSGKFDVAPTCAQPDYNIAGNRKYDPFYSSYPYKSAKKDVVPTTSVATKHRQGVWNNMQLHAKLPIKDAHDYLGVKGFRSPNDVDLHADFHGLAENNSSKKVRSYIPPSPRPRVVNI